MSESMFQVRPKTQLLTYPFWQRDAAWTWTVSGEQDYSSSFMGSPTLEIDKHRYCTVVIVLCCCSMDSI